MRTSNSQQYKTSKDGINNVSKTELRGVNENQGENKSLLEREMENLGVPTETVSAGQEKAFRGEKMTQRQDVAKEKVSSENVIDNRLRGGKKFLTILTGIIVSGVLCAGVCQFYTNQIRFPSVMEIDTTKTGSYCLSNWQLAVNGVDDSLADMIGEQSSFLSQELLYANKDEDKIKFIKKIASTVKYIPEQVVAIDKYGNKMVDRSGNLVYIDSNVVSGDVVPLTLVDYSKIELNEDSIKQLMKDNNLKVGDVDYSNKLVKVFCQYINSIDVLPTRVISEYVPNIVVNSDGSYSPTKDEDIAIDKLLFSSNEFFDFCDRFSEVAGSSKVGNPKWVKWRKASAKKRAKYKEPPKFINSMQPTKEWQKWNKLKGKQKSEQEEPQKYDKKLLMSKIWCGTYYLQNEYSEVDENGKKVLIRISAMVGDGTFKDPAGLNTDILTDDFTEVKGKQVKQPIKVRMTEFGASKKAIDWFEGKDERNRGIDIKSEVQYCYYVFEVTNMSNRKMVVYDNSSLCDKNANLSSRTGVMYGLQDKVVLNPDETGVIETWGMSTELNKQYVIWGKDFDRRIDPVWFRVLQGDIDDPSEDKGVMLNKTRLGE